MGSITLTFSPEIIFKQLDGYILQVFQLDNKPLLNPRSFNSRTLGTITIVENLGEKNIQLVKRGITLYSATKAENWTIRLNSLNQNQIRTIETLPQNKEELFLEFYGRSLTTKLKEAFQFKGYQINFPIVLTQAQVPYSFRISEKSTKKKIIFIGINDEGTPLFESSFEVDQGEPLIRVAQNKIPLHHISQLCD